MPASEAADDVHTTMPPPKSKRRNPSQLSRTGAATIIRPWIESRPACSLAPASLATTVPRHVAALGGGDPKHGPGPGVVATALPAIVRTAPEALLVLVPVTARARAPLERFPRIAIHISLDRQVLFQ